MLRSQIVHYQMQPSLHLLLEELPTFDKECQSVRIYMEIICVIVGHRGLVRHWVAACFFELFVAFRLKKLTLLLIL